MTLISLAGITGFGHHGVLDFERKLGQPFEVDVSCLIDRPSAADDLATTLDYGSLSAAIVADIEGEPFDLIETLAERIAANCLRRELVREVTVTVHKPRAPLPVVAQVSVTITRRREP